MTGSYTGGLLSLATAGLTAILIVLVLEHDHSLECVAGENHAPEPTRRPKDAATSRGIFRWLPANSPWSHNDLLSFLPPLSTRPTAPCRQLILSRGPYTEGAQVSVQVVCDNSKGTPHLRKITCARKTKEGLAVILPLSLLRTRRRARCFFSSGQFPLHLQEGEEES